MCCSVWIQVYIYIHTLLVDLCQRARRTPFELTSDKFVFWGIVVVCEPTNTSSQTDFNCPKERHFFTTNIHQQSLLIHIHKKKKTSISVLLSTGCYKSRNHGFRPQAPRGFKALGHGSKLHHGIMRLNGGDLEGITGHSEASEKWLLVFWENF